MKSIITFSMALMASFAVQASTVPGLVKSSAGINLGNGATSHPKYVNEETVQNPSAYITSGYVKSLEEVARDNKQILDSQDEEKAPLYFEASASEIKEANRITEAQMPKYAPLDFRYINKAQSKLRLPEALPKL